MYRYFELLLSSKAQIAFLRKELSEKEMSKHEADILSVFVIQVQQQLQQQEEKVQHRQLKKEEQLKKKGQQQLKDREQQPEPKRKEKGLKENEDEGVEQEQYKEHKQANFDGEAHFIQHQERKE